MNLRSCILFVALIWASVDVQAQTFGVANPLKGRPNEIARVGGVTVRELPNLQGQPRAFYFVSKMDIDADGAINAYHPMDAKIPRKPDKPNIRLDPQIEQELQAARSLPSQPRTQWGLDDPKHGAAGGALKIDGQRVIQEAPGLPGYGYYISPTSLVDRTYTSERDPRRYVDPLKTPYVALPLAVVAEFEDKYHVRHGIRGGARLGDICLVVNHRTGQQVFAVFADVGPSDKIGEGSIELAKRLGIENTSPINGGAPAGTISYVIFPGSGRGQGYIPSNREIHEQGQYLIRGWRGIEGLSSNIVRDNYPEPGIRTSSRTTRFDKPMLSGRPLDHCLSYAAHCDKPAADEFCRRNGFQKASGWNVAPVAQTNIPSGQKCDAPSRCDAFINVVCE